ncbi:MAG: S-methyl-5-thioribose-1-phosphate isomerase [Coriobacteriia bacterium]|nr:S-methyl-5-thioribose-1-phosphate isomerase [Coriobacteriia bacterium]
MSDETKPTSGIDNIPRTIWWGEDETTGRPVVYMVDQTRLPLQGDILACNIADGVCLAIKTLAVRGAPALGVAGALALALWTENESEEFETVGEYLEALDAVSETVSTARPTAINLMWGVQRIRLLAHENADMPLGELKELVVQEALNMQAEDEERNRTLGRFGADLLPDKAKVLTHCNAGSLATAYFGTALGVIFTAHEDGKIEHVWVDETRPVNQGGRLTAWELRLAGVPSALIADNMAASVMKSGWVDAVIVGADRICANGDTANKIGTYGLAILAAEHDIPFYVAAPSSTIDLTLSSGDQIPIEERDPRELTGFTVAGTFEPDSPEASRAFDALTKDGAYEMPMARGHQMTLHRKGGGYSFDAWFKVTPPGIEVYNPAFDVTPSNYITAIITERGVIRPEPDFETAISLATMGSGAIHEIGMRREVRELLEDDPIFGADVDLL